MAGLNVKVEVAKTSITREQVLKYIHEKLIELWKDSTRAFILETVKYVHVDTGMSMASLFPLAEKLKYAEFVSAELLRANGSKPGYKYGGTKSVTRGKEFGRQAYRLDFGTTISPVLKFDFQTVVYQYSINEIGMGNNNQDAWNSLEKGKASFLEFFESQFENYMDLPTLGKLLLGVK